MKKQFTKVAMAAVLCTGMMAGIVGCGKSDDGATSIAELNLDDYISIENYKDLTISLDGVYEVEDSEVDEYCDYYLLYASSYASTDNLITDRAAQNGDAVNIDYAGYKDGEAFEGGTAENQILVLGSGSFIDGFEEKLIGVMPGETVDLDLTFPENYGEESLAGAAVVFTVTVHGMVPEENIIEAWNTSIIYDGTAKTRKDVWNYYKESLESNLASTYNTDLENAIIDDVLSGVTYKKDFPESLVKTYSDNAQGILDNYANTYGVDADTIAQYMFGITADEYVNTYSYEQIKIDMSLYYIAQKEGLVVPEEGLKDRILAYYEESGVTITEDDIDEDALQDYKLYFTEIDVLDYLKTVTTVNK